jgi:hypothetical protein
MSLTKLLPWYYIDYLKFGDMLLFMIPFEEHLWGVKMMIFSPTMKFGVFIDSIVCVRFLGNGEMKPYTHLSGWWIMCDKQFVEVQNALTSMATYGICANQKQML